MTEATFWGLDQAQRQVVGPRQWGLLLQLAAGPQPRRALLLTVPWRQRGAQRWALWRLWQHGLVMFHMKQGTWMLTAYGESLRPVLVAIRACH